MMNVLKAISFLLVLSLLNNAEINGDLVKVDKEDFPQFVTIEGEEILKNDFNHHHRIFVIDTLLLTMVNSGPYQYHLFNKESQNYLGAIGVRGEGPNEWIIPQTTSGQFEQSPKGLLLWKFDYLRGNFSQINLTRTIQEKSPNPIMEKNIRINMKVFPFFQLYASSSGKIFANPWIYEANKPRIKSYDPKSNMIRKSGLFPTMENVNILPAEVVHSIYGGSFEKHPTKDIFVQALFVFNRIDIFDEDLHLLKSIVGGENWKNNYYNAQEINIASNYITERIEGYNGLALSERHIYALEAKKNEGTEEEKENESFIRVYDWEGNPKCYLEVKHDLSAIAIDDKHEVLYATDYDHELVLKFDLSDLISSWK